MERYVSRHSAAMDDLTTSSDAFVLTGSGANAAYEVGVLKGLLGGRWGTNGSAAVTPHCFCGNSVGALNAAIVVSNADLGYEDALRRLESVWLDRIAVDSASSVNGIFRIRAEPTQYLNMSQLANPFQPFLQLAADSFHLARRSVERLAFATSSVGAIPDAVVRLSEFNEFVDISPLERLVRETVDTKKIAASQLGLRITTLNWSTGAPKTFRNSDFRSGDGHQTIVAALALPGMVAPQIVNGMAHVDTCVLMDEPLKPAILALLENESDLPRVLHVVYVDATVRDIPLPPLSNTFSTVYRLYMLALSRAVNADIGRAANLNESIWLKKLLETVVAADGSTEDAENALTTRLGEESVSVYNRLHRKLEDRKALTIHRYAPREHLYGFESIQFRRDTIAQLIEHGYEAARNHDCEESRCILPETTPELERIASS